jgi:hypothetical protein
VTFAEAAVVAAHRGLDQAHRVAVGSFEPILTEGNRHWLADGVAPKLRGLGRSEGGLGSRGPEMPLNGSTN